MLKRIMSALRSASEATSSVTTEFAHINIKRIFPASVCCIALNAAAIIMLVSLPRQNSLWQSWQIWINALMMVLVLCFLTYIFILIFQILLFCFYFN